MCAIIFLILNIYIAICIDYSSIIWMKTTISNATAKLLILNKLRMTRSSWKFLKLSLIIKGYFKNVCILNF